MPPIDKIPTAIPIFSSVSFSVVIRPMQTLTGNSFTQKFQNVFLVDKLNATIVIQTGTHFDVKFQDDGEKALQSY